MLNVVIATKWNQCTNCKSAQYCTTRGHPLPFP